MARSYDPAKTHFWRQVLARQQASGLTVRAYCAAHGLSQANCYLRTDNASWRFFRQRIVELSAFRCDKAS